MAEAKLKAEVREATGKQGAKNLRRQGLVPGIFYGMHKEPVSLSIDGKELSDLLHSFGRNMVVNLTVGSDQKKITAFIYEIQHEPITGNIIHVDFKHISLKEKIHVAVPVRLEGTSWGVKNEGGILENTMHTIDVSCLPGDIPESLVFDVSEMRIGDVIHVSDITEKNFEILSDKDNTIVHVVAPKIAAVEEVEEEAEEEELAELEEPTEPEVIGAKKQEEKE